MPTILDHLFAAVLVAGVPLYAALFSWPRMKRELASAGPAVRIRIYWLNIAVQWGLTLGCLGVWQLAGRPPADLGLGLRLDWRFWAALAAAGIVAAGLTMQYLVLLRGERSRRRLREMLERNAPFTPRSRREMGHFSMLSLTAGVCEEILYRGFLIWYVAQFTGVTLPGVSAAVVLSAVVFGIGHLYQGPKQAAQVVGLALIAGVLYVLSRSLWIVMVMHAYIDVAGGLVSLTLYRDRPATPAPAPDDLR